MLYLYINKYANNVEPNTTIEGVGSTITSPYILSQRLGINVNRIKAFKVTSVGSVTCRILGSYELKKDAFYNDAYIVSFIDSEGLVIGFGANAFRSSTVVRVYTPNATYASGYSEADSGAFRNATRLVECVHALESVGLATFQNTTSLGLMDVSKMRILGSVNPLANWTYNFRSSKGNFGSFNSLILFYNYQTFTLNTGTSVWDFPALEQILGSRHDPFISNTEATEYRFPVLRVANIAQGFQGNTKLKRLVFPVLETIADAVETEGSLGSAGIIRSSGVKDFIANNIVILSNASLFIKAPYLELVEMKKCRRFGKYVDGTDTNFFNESSVGVRLTVRVHEANLVVDNGTINKVLLQAKTGMGAVVEFYNDAGEYVSTL